MLPGFPRPHPTAAAAQGLVVVRPSKPDVRLGAILGPAMGFLECSQGDAAVRALCRAVGLKASAAAGGVRVNSRGLVFAYDDGTSRGVDTGHSCTVTAEIKHTHAEARLLADASLDFSGGSLLSSASDPVLFVAELPVEFAARVEVKQRFGTRLLGKCLNVGSDSFRLGGAVTTTACSSWSRAPTSRSARAEPPRTRPTRARWRRSCARPWRAL